MFRTILLPTLVAALIAVPMLYQKSNSVDLATGLGGAPPNRDYNQDYSYNYYVNPPSQPVGNSGANLQRPGNGFSFNNATPVASNQFHNAALTGSGNQNLQAASSAIPASNRSFPGSVNRNLPPMTGGVDPVASGSGNSSFRPAAGGQFPGAAAVDFSQLTPDYGAIETQTYRGNAFGPDLNSQPLQFIPVTNFQEIFRFDVSPMWVKQRWQRLTAIPADGGLHGLRTALVTGTNSWDLNGSLTYFFDQNHRTQRIAFRGWVGDPTRLVNLATQHFGFKPQPTHWAGLYLAEFGGSQTGVLLMKDPDIIDSRNHVQQTAVIMEVNQPAGGFQLSQEVLGFLQPALPNN